MDFSKNIQTGPAVPSAAAKLNTVDQLVVNWHLTEACNYSCRYCYSSWEKTSDLGELFHDQVKTQGLLSELKSFFSQGNKLNPLASHLQWNSLRLSLAGGEPLLNPARTSNIIMDARGLGYDVSLITNASRLSKTCPSLLGQLSILGVSLDSADEKICGEIGRVDQCGQVLDLAALGNIFQRVRSENPDISIKINTVVNQLNWKEDLSGLIEQLRPDKWKVLRVLPVLSKELAVTQKQYDLFLHRHQRLSKFISAEDNHEMAESYLMVDPHGRFFQNHSDFEGGPNSYLYSEPILQVGAEAAFVQIAFDAQKFAARYPKAKLEVAA